MGWQLTEENVWNKLSNHEYDFIIFDIRGNFLFVKINGLFLNQLEKSNENLGCSGEIMLDGLLDLLGIAEKSLIQVRLICVTGSENNIKFQISQWKR